MVRNFLLGSIVAVACFLSGFQANAECSGSPPLSDAQVIRTYKTFEHLLKASPDEQHRAWLKVKNQFRSVGDLLAYARDQVSQNLAEQLREEREYRRDWANGCPGSSSSGNQCRAEGYSCSIPSDCCSSICSGKARCR